MQEDTFKYKWQGHSVNTPFVGLRAIEENTTNATNGEGLQLFRKTEFWVSHTLFHNVKVTEDKLKISQRKDLGPTTKAFGPLVSLCSRVFLFDSRSSSFTIHEAQGPYPGFFQAFHATPLRFSITWMDVDSSVSLALHNKSMCCVVLSADYYSSLAIRHLLCFILACRPSPFSLLNFFLSF